MIDMLPHDCKTQLLAAYNRLWFESAYADDWTKSVVVPIYKGKGERTNPGNYRPIFLNSCLGKVFERMVNNRLVHILESNELLHEHQYAFRKGRTTVDHLGEMDITIRHALNKNEYVQAVFLDITKAYDTTWRRLVLEKLRSWNIGGEMLRYLYKSLQKRTFRVRANGQLSEEKMMETGLCQGSVLSVTLFLVAIDTIKENLPAGVKLLLYADDVVLIASGTDQKRVTANLRKALCEIQKWQQRSGYRISAEKSVTMAFRKPKTRRSGEANKLRLNNQTIPRRNHYRCLGTSCLQFKTHVEELKTSVQQRLLVLQSVARRNWGGDRTTLTKIYKACILEKILYAAPIVAAMSDTNTKLLETVHNRGLRAICGGFHTSPIASLQVETGIPGLRTLLDQRTAIYTAKRMAKDEQKRKQEIDITTRVESTDPEDILDDSTSNPSSGDLWDNRPARSLNTVLDRGAEIINDLGIELPPINILLNPKCPPWNRTKLPVDKFLLHCLRNGASSAELSMQFANRIATRYRFYRTIYTDGSKRGSRCGYSMVTRETVIRKRINDMSSIFAAESLAIQEALSWVASQERVGAYLICTDSLSVITALETYKIKSNWRDDIANSYRKATSKGTAVHFCWVPSHSGLHGNERADREAKRALEQQEVLNIAIDIKEIKRVMKTASLSKWQSAWIVTRNNKLREIKNSVLPFREAVIGTRRDDVALARLRIGHTKFTHQYLLEKEDPPHCRRCNARLTVKHIVAECPLLDEERKKENVPANIREALADDKIRATNLLNFFKNIRLYNEI
ncbi:uncharacterized protein LOC131680873 [Topomyia yanbarensis]|uniref:uncharacterized protein LOC131680873 n=1 Tax=Topomyia yanbarensis TaxID=2498891 RepID=UPI00273AAC6E|nr:uncharacterized protein LOC131680873 [Topomyia yanbarensis]